MSQSLWVGSHKLSGCPDYVEFPSILPSVFEMAHEQRTQLEERYRDSHFKGKITKEWSKREYGAKIIELQEKLAALTPEVAY